MKLYSPNKCLQFVHKLKSVADAINAQAPTVARTKRDCGEEFTHSLLMAWLVYLNEILGLKNPMSESQIQLCATHILKEFNYLKFSDLSLLFNRIITGQYGEFYESLTIAKVLTFFREYDKERTEVAIDEAERQHAEFRYEESKNESQFDFLKRKIKKLYR
ncbi:DUF6633 family protein [Capnocytophaga stomatis]|uniref:DUF6633 family protein n=1 Tax=Capnocytophaga stomatis TaxID=1848904 RepID=UPI0021011BA1|nr:DUF6633 family protein [Capnocytophaga stomatis]